MKRGEKNEAVGANKDAKEEQTQRGLGSWDPHLSGKVLGLGLGLGGGPRAALSQQLVDVRGEESRVGVPVHQRVDLELSVLKHLRRRVLHLLVDYLSYPGIQTDLWGQTPQTP